MRPISTRRRRSLEGLQALRGVRRAAPLRRRAACSSGEAHRGPRIATTERARWLAGCAATQRRHAGWACDHAHCASATAASATRRARCDLRCQPGLSLEPRVRGDRARYRRFRAIRREDATGVSGDDFPADAGAPERGVRSVRENAPGEAILRRRRDAAERPYLRGGGADQRVAGTGFACIARRLLPGGGRRRGRCRLPMKGR